MTHPVHFRAMFFFFLKQFFFFKQAKIFFNVFKKSFSFKKEKNFVKEKEKSAFSCLRDEMLWAYLKEKSRGMGYAKKIVRNMPKCLHCGDQIKYGRTDKKFCCDECRNRHYNEQTKAGKMFRRKIMSQLLANYDVLDTLFKAGVGSVDLIDAVTMGFVPGIVTSYRRVGKHDEFCCFDIKYILTRTRIYSISKLENVSLHLQVLSDRKQ